LNLLGQQANLSTFLFIGWGHLQGQQQAQRIDDRDCTKCCVNGSDENTTIKINDQLVQDFGPMR
jgi:hypothetical protein